MSREHTGHRKHSSNETRDDSTHEHHHIVNTEVILIIFFAIIDGEAQYNQKKKKKRPELTVAQSMNFLFQNSDLNWSRKKNTGHSGII